MFLFFNWRWALLLAVLLAGCQTIEHRSEIPEKKPLPELSQKTEPKRIWANADSAGVGKSEAKPRLVVCDNAIYTADHTGNVWAFNRITGETLWKINVKKTITSGPTVHQNTLVIGTRDAKVMALDANNGHLEWEVPVSGEVLAAPTIGYGGVFVHSLDGSVTALNLEDGKLLWRFNSQSPSIVLRRSSSPLVTDSYVIVGLSNGKLVSLHRMDGTIEWEREIAIPKGRSDIQRMVDITADPVLKDNTLHVVSYQGRLASLSPENGQSHWEKDMSSYSGLAIAKNTLFVSGAKGEVYAVDRNKGDILWKQEALLGRHLSAPAIIGNQLVVGDDEGNLHWLSQTEGSLIKRASIDSKGVDANPIVFDNKIYVLGRGGKIAAFQGSD